MTGAADILKSSSCEHHLETSLSVLLGRKDSEQQQCPGEGCLWGGKGESRGTIVNQPQGWGFSSNYPEASYPRLFTKSPSDSSSFSSPNSFSQLSLPPPSSSLILIFLTSSPLSFYIDWSEVWLFISWEHFSKVRVSRTMLDHNTTEVMFLIDK